MGSSVDDRPLIEAVDEGVLTLTLNRPEQRNALDTDLRDALAGALDRAARDPEVCAVIVTGAGGTFCAGGDLGSFEELHDASVYRPVSHPLSELMDAVERLLEVAADSDPHSTMLAESLAQTMLLATNDHREGLGAVRERREPEFTAR